MKKYHGLGKRERVLLQIAAILHDCGKYVTMNQPSDASYHIIMSTEIIGLSHSERETVANTAELVENALKENPILKELAEINLNTLTPLDCMRLLFEWKEKL